MRGSQSDSDRQLWKEGFWIFQGFCFFFFLLVVGLLWSAWAEAGEPQGPDTGERVRLNDVQSGELLFSVNGGDYTPALLLSTEVDIQATGLIATVTLTQEFRNDSQSWVEGVYVFPLPETAAVYGLKLLVGERVIEGEVQERAAARSRFDQARQNGQLAVLVEQQRPNLFTHNIANIGPSETVRVTIEYLQDVAYEQGHFSLRFPLTLTPRYMPGVAQVDPHRAAAMREAWDAPPSVAANDLGWAVNTDQVPDAERISPWTVPERRMDARSHRVTLRAAIRPGLALAEVQSHTHAIQWQTDGSLYQVHLLDQQVPMDRDFVLSWAPVVGQAPEAAVFTEIVEGDTFSLLMLMPPQQIPGDLALPRETIWVVDTSGSMEGVSMAQARMALAQALDTLRPQDRFNIIQFNSFTHSLFPQAVPATADNLAQARHYADGLRADGGTEMAAALDAALTGQAPEGYVRQVVFLTDGSVGNEQALFAKIESQLGQSRLFTVGIGPAPNGYFMRKAADFGRGSSTMISSGAEVGEKMRALVRQLETPVLRDVRVQWPAQARAIQEPLTVPDLYQGKPLMMVAKWSGSGTAVDVAGYQAGNLRDGQPLWKRQLQLGSAGQGKGIARLWARKRIDQLLDQKVLGTAEEEIRDAVLPLALQYQLVSPYTSLVAVDKTPARTVNDPLQTEAVATLLPAGISENMMLMPGTATASGLHLRLGLGLLVLALMLWLAGRRAGQALSRPGVSV